MKHLNYYNVVCLFFAVFIFSCENKNEEVINFEKIESLFCDTSLNNICIRKIPTNKNFNKFIFINRDKVYIISKGFFYIDVHGNDFNDVSKNEVLKDFKYYSTILNSKGIFGSCLSIDSTLVLETKNFDVKELQLIDTSSIYKKYQYICMTTKDIRLSFVPHEYCSELFFRKPIYFYYSEK